MHKRTVAFIVFSIIFCCQSSAQVWNVIASGSGSGNGYTSLLSDNDSLYVGGTFDSIGGIAADNVAVWDGARWASVGTGMGSSHYTSTSVLYKYNRTLYFGAEIDLNNAQEGLAKYNGTSWSRAGRGIRWYGENHSPGLAVEAITEYNSSMYVGGLFDTADSYVVVDYIASYDGSLWYAVGGITYPNVEITALAVYQGKLYAGSYRGLYAWDGSIWTQVATVNVANNFGNSNDGIKSLVVDGNALYVGGGFDSINSMPYANVVKYDGTNWTTLNAGTNYPVAAMAMYNSSLYVCGSFTGVDGLPTSGVAVWNGFSWTAFGAGHYNGTFSSGNSLAVHNNSLYMGSGYELLKLDNASGVADIKESAMTLRPNPAHITVTLVSDDSLTGSDYVVTDAIGRPVISGVISGRETAISVADVDRGVYVLHVGGVRVFKFVKE